MRVTKDNVKKANETKTEKITLCKEKTKPMIKIGSVLPW